MHIKKIDDNLDFLKINSIYLKSSVIYQDGKTNDTVYINCSRPNTYFQHTFCDCNIINPNISNNITNVAINNYSFIISINETYNEILSEDQILLSSLAKEKIKNIETQNGDLNYWVFLLTEEPNITKNEVLLYGQIDSGHDEPPNNFTFNLNLTDLKENTNCNYYNYSNSNSQIITFTPKNNINAHLNGMMSMISDSEYYILLFTNNTDDLVLYSTVKSSSIDLYGFESYNKPENKSAENVAVFFGTSNILKKYLSFTAKVRYVSNSTLRFLEEKTTNVTANGTIIPDSTDIDNGVFKYKTVYKGTEDFDILEMDSWHDYKFSDDNISFTPAKANIVGEYINLTNKYELEKPVFMNFLYGNPTVDGNTFSFKFQLNSNDSNMNITNKQPIFLNYTSMETSQPDEIDSCTIENNSNIFTINCEPKKDIYTLLNSLIIKVPYNITKNRRLRFLQSSGNSTIRVPKTTTGDIQFDYNPEVNTFGRKSSKKKGLSGGAIAAIVLATIAAVVAVGVAMFFLNRGPINPIKTSTEMNLPNSTTNINN